MFVHVLFIIAQFLFFVLTVISAGHSKPVDVWAMGVITYFLLSGVYPFDRDTRQAEREAIIAGDYRFEPNKYWADISDTARDFIKRCLTIDSDCRMTVVEALKHQVG
jgi:serine/threonine protein kinase